MALTPPFRGAIPDWLNPNIDGHPYWKPPEIPMKYFGREYLDGASAVYAFAPEHLRHNLTVADEDLRLLGVPTIHDREQALQHIEHVHRADHEVVLERTPEFMAWNKWNGALNEVWGAFIYPLHNGDFTAFGDPDRAGRPPEWIHPLNWMELKPDPRIPSKFSGDGQVFWNVRIVKTIEILAIDKKMGEQTQQDQENRNKCPAPSRRKPAGLDYRASDTPLAHEMKRMVEAREAKNPTDAARILARQAKGAGQEGSKVSRLLGLYAVLFRAEQD
ncbi:MAG: hypothetical protein ACRYHQ_30565 [Janthinobacterium lividum]